MRPGSHCSHFAIEFGPRHETLIYHLLVSEWLGGDVVSESLSNKIKSDQRVRSDQIGAGQAGLLGCRADLQGLTGNS